MLLGQTVGGRYQIFTQLGRGGFGATFLAQDIQRPGNPHCVVKHFKPVSDDAYTLQQAKRFFDLEAATLEILGKHDQIPQLLAHFEENQEFYLVQEFISGHDLTEEIPPMSGLLGEAEVIQLLKDILEVLAFVHQNNVIHRDLKPANIRRRDSDNKIVLIDFGAVKQISTQIANSQGNTTFTVAIGTHGYMPSEQANQTPQLNSDIFAVGVIAIQALTGINPVTFGGLGLPKNHNTGEIDWRDQAQVSPQLAEVIDTMVRYDFRQRYPTAQATLQALATLSTVPATTINQKYFQFPTSNRKYIIAGSITGAVATLIVLSSQFITPKQNFRNYENFSYGINIQYPEGWERQDVADPITKEVVIFLSPKQSDADKFQEKLIIRTENLSSTLDESRNMFIQEINKSLPDAKIINTSETTMANKRAYKLVFTGKDGDNKLKSLQVWTLKGDQAYIITYTATIDDYEKFLQIAETMIQSFKIE